MLGKHEKQFKTHLAVSLEALVPQTNFYRQLEAKVELSFVYDLVSDYYAAGRGRPSIDPVIFFKLQLIMFFEGLRSELQLMELVNLNLAHRWYLGYDLDEAVPDHSSLSKIRSRYGVAVFQRFFEQIVERCIEAGLVWGRELYFDATRVKANAALRGTVPRWYWQAKQHVHALFEAQASAEQQAVEPAPSPTEQRLAKYNGQRLNSRHESTYERIADRKVSPTSREATPMSRFTGDRAELGYHTHYVIDGGKARIILAALVTPASVMENTPMLDLARWVRFRWHLKPAIAVGDAKYGTIPNIVGLVRDGVRAYLPVTDFSPRKHLYRAESFRYDAERDGYLCPQGQFLPLNHRGYQAEVFAYQAQAAVCNACPVKAHCTDSQQGRQIFRSFFQDELDRAKVYRETEAYHKALRKRQVWIEPLFGEGKQWHGMRSFRLRGLEKVNIEELMRAVGQNIKRLLTNQRRRRPQPPSTGAVLLSLSPIAVRCPLNPLLSSTRGRRLFQQPVLLYSQNCLKPNPLVKRKWGARLDTRKGALTFSAPFSIAARLTFYCYKDISYT